MTEFAWAIIGPGGIAHHFAAAVNGMPGTRIHSVFGRNPDNAGLFARKWDRPSQPAIRVASSIDALLDDPSVDAVYIATPHSHHAEAIRLCLAARKPVLCEKPLVTGAAAAQALIALSRQQNTFLMEALWTRMLPAYAQIGAWIEADLVGEIHAIQSSFCFAPAYDPESRLFNLQLAGGTLLDIGIYNIAMSRWVLETASGKCPETRHIHVHGKLAPTGADQRVCALMHFDSGAVAQFICAFDSVSDNALRIIGSKGSIVVPANFWAGTTAILMQDAGRSERVDLPFAINGFEYEIEEAMRCIRHGLIESPRMPHRESLALITCIDDMRRQIGVRYPFD